MQEKAQLGLFEAPRWRGGGAGWGTLGLGLPSVLKCPTLFSSWAGHASPTSGPWESHKWNQQKQSFPLALGSCLLTSAQPLLEN